jgi:hypothetical protein
MLLLAGTSALVKVVTSAAQEIMVQASYADYNGTVTPTTVTPSTQNTTISSATTTTVVGSPATNVQRNVKFLSFFNDGASANTLTVEHTDGTTPVTLAEVTLSAGDTLLYDEGNGWSHTNSSGQILVATINGAVQMATSSSALVPTSTSSFVMGGMGAQITPARSGNVMAVLTGYLTTSAVTINEGIILQLAYGTGSAPAYQAAAAGTVFGKAVDYANAIAWTTAADSKQPVTVQGLVTGLTIGTTIWVDFQMEGITAEDVSLNNAVLTLVEI